VSVENPVLCSCHAHQQGIWKHFAREAHDMYEASKKGRILKLTRNNVTNLSELIQDRSCRLLWWALTSCSIMVRDFSKMLQCNITTGLDSDLCPALRSNKWAVKLRLFFRNMWVGFVFIYVTAVAVPRDEGHRASRTCTVVIYTRETLWSVTLQRDYSLVFIMALNW
jgi:hypothetical protein